MKPEDYKAWSDEDLAVLCQRSGDNGVFEELWRRHSRRIYNQCLAFSGIPDQAEELTAETFHRVWRQISQYKSGNFSAWLSVIARNLCLNRVDERWSRSVRTVGHDITTVGDEQQPNDRLAGNTEFEVSLRQLVNELPDDQRNALKLFHIDGLTYEEVAGRMNCSTKQVKSHLQSARRMLRIWWEESRLSRKERSGNE